MANNKIGCIDTIARAMAANGGGGGGGDGRCYIGTLTGDGTTTDFSVAHNLNNLNAIVLSYDESQTDVLVDVTRIDANNLIIGFNEAPAVGVVYTVVVCDPQGAKGNDGRPGKVQDVLNHEGETVVDPVTGIATLPEGHVYTAGPGIHISDDDVISAEASVILDASQVISMDPVRVQLTNEQYAVLQDVNNNFIRINALALGLGSTVFTKSVSQNGNNYVLLNNECYYNEESGITIGARMDSIIVSMATKIGTYSIVEISNTSWGEITGNITNQTDLIGKLNEKMSLVQGGHAMIEWDGDTTNHALITITGEKPTTLAKVSDITYDSGKDLRPLYATIKANGESTTSTLGDLFTAGGGESTGQYCYGATTDAVLVMCVLTPGTHTIPDTGTFTATETGFYVWYDQSQSGYISRVNDGPMGQSFIEQNEADITEDTADVLSEYLATQTQIVIINQQIDNLKNLGRFLAIWDCTSGLPTTQPPRGVPFVYATGDYYRVGNVGTTNYKPEGTEYTGAPSTSVESEEVTVGAVYYFDGSAWAMQAAGAGGKVQDVQLAGASILSGGIANIPIAGSELGVVKVNSGQGLAVNSTAGNIYIAAAPDSNIINKNNSYQPITPSNLDVAIREGLGNNALTWTDAYKTSARTTIGAQEEIDIIISSSFLN